MAPEEIDAVAVALGRDVTGVRTLTGGFSHETCLVELGAERVVVRLGGPDPVIEAAVMTAASEHVPVPEVLRVLPAPAPESAAASASAPASADPEPRPAMVLAFVRGTALEEVLSGKKSADEAGMADLGAEVGGVFGRIGHVTFGKPGFFASADLAVREMDPGMKNLPEMAANCMAATPDSRLDPEARRAWITLCAEHAPALARIDAQARLVHADANPKNVLVSRTPEGWQVDAVIDWEFSFSGCPYADAANMTRFAADYPPGFAEGFRAAFGAAQADNSNKDWGYLGRVLDMFALSDAVTRPEGRPVADRAAVEIRRWLAEGVPSAPTHARTAPIHAGGPRSRFLPGQRVTGMRRRSVGMCRRSVGVGWGSVGVGWGEDRGVPLGRQYGEPFRRGAATDGGFRGTREDAPADGAAAGPAPVPASICLREMNVESLDSGLLMAPSPHSRRCGAAPGRILPPPVLGVNGRFAWRLSGRLVSEALA